MKTGKSSAATLGLVGGIVLGAWIGSELTTGREAAAPAPVAVSSQVVEEPAAPTAPARAKKRVVRAASSALHANPGVAVDAPAPEATPKLVMTIPVSAPELHARMKPVMARGTKLPLAVAGFTDAAQFAALAHAARNTQVPFILLKHRVLTEGQSLEDAIRASRPDIDAKTEALKAKGAARADILSLTMNSSASN